MTRRRSFLQQVAYDSHEVSKYAGDASALQRGGVPMLGRRLVRRWATRNFFSLLNRNGLR